MSLTVDSEIKMHHTKAETGSFEVVRVNIDDAKIPTRATSGSAGYDLYSYEETVIRSGARGIVRTGLTVSIPKGYCGQIWSRSGFSAKNGIETGAGIIDSDYTGELMVILYNYGSDDFKVEKHMRMAQLLIVKIDLPLVVDATDKVVSKLNDQISKLTARASKLENEKSKLENETVKQNTRGTGGFGSTGFK
jgi:dUTP pyrophosphatase